MVMEQRVGGNLQGGEGGGVLFRGQGKVRAGTLQRGYQLRRGEVGGGSCGSCWGTPPPPPDKPGATVLPGTAWYC